MSVPKAPNLATASGRTTLLMGLGVATKLVVDVLIITAFGLTSATDAFFVAYTLLILIESLVYPASQSGLVPIFVGLIRTQGTEAVGPHSRVWTAFNSLLTLAVIVGAGLTTSAVLGNATLSRLLAPGLDAETGALAARLSGIMFVSLVFVLPIGVMRAFLNAHNLFTAPASHELLRGTTVIAVIAGFGVITPALRIEHLALGYAIAALVQATVFGAVIWRHLGPHYRPAIDLALLRAVGVRRMLTLPLLEQGIAQSVLVAERVIGSFLPPGSISALSYGHRLASVIGNSLFTGIEVVSLSTLATSLATRTAAGLRQARATLLAAMRLVILVGVPIAAMIWAVQLPVTHLLFEREGGASGSEAARILGIYALTIPLYGYLLVARSYWYADGRPLLPILIASAQLVAMVSVAPFLATALGAPGVAWAYAIGQLVACGVAAATLRGIGGPGQNRNVAWLGLRVTGAALVTASLMAAVVSQPPVLARWTGAASFPAHLAMLVLAGILGLITLLGIGTALQIEELRSARSAVLARLRKGRGIVRHRNQELEQEA